MALKVLKDHKAPQELQVLRVRLELQVLRALKVPRVLLVQLLLGS
jgi:hypothetical protein